MDHKKDIKEFEKEAKKSDAVGGFANETLPTLRKHLDKGMQPRGCLISRLERSRPLARLFGPEGERNRDERRQFIRKAIRLCSRVAFSIRCIPKDA